jgi:L-asparaginase
VRLLSSGGTIATRQAGATTVPELSARELVEIMGGLGLPSDIELDAQDLRLQPSWSLTGADMDAIARAAVAAAEEPGTAGVVVTHGTTTLEYTAYLTDLRHGGDRPIAFTGAMRRPDEPEPDGPANLRDAITVAADPGAAELGSLVVFAGQILSAREAWKQHRSAVEAFVGLDGGMGAVSGGNVRIDHRPPRTRVFDGPIESQVALVKAYPGAGRELVDAAVDAGARGVVVEGLPGVGGVPRAMQAGLRAAAKSGLPVVLASRAPRGVVPADASGGTGEPLAGIGLISAGILTAEKAWVLLMMALGETTDRAQVRPIFEEVTQQREREEEHD